MEEEFKKVASVKMKQSVLLYQLILLVSKSWYNGSDWTLKVTYQVRNVNYYQH